MCGGDAAATSLTASNFSRSNDPATELPMRATRGDADGPQLKPAQQLVRALDNMLAAQPPRVFADMFYLVNERVRYEARFARGAQTFGSGLRTCGDACVGQSSWLRVFVGSLTMSARLFAPCGQLQARCGRCGRFKMHLHFVCGILLLGHAPDSSTCHDHMLPSCCGHMWCRWWAARRWSTLHATGTTVSSSTPSSAPPPCHRAACLLRFAWLRCSLGVPVRDCALLHRANLRVAFAV